MRLHNTRRTLAILFAVLAALPITAFFALGSTCSFAVCKPFYQYEYQKNNTLSVLGTDEPTLEAMTEAMIGYLSGKRRTLQITGNIHNVNQEVFSNQAIIHMADVLGLFLLAYEVLIISAALIALLLLLSVTLAPAGSRIRCLCKGILIGLGVAMAGFAVLSLIVASNFTQAFTQFHHLFFTNELWLFSNTDTLIQMLPTEFFMDIVLGIGISFSLCMALLIALCILGIRCTGKQQPLKEAADRPDAQEIFDTMEIHDDTSVSPQAKCYLDNINNEAPDTAFEEAAPAEAAAQEVKSNEPITAGENELDITPSSAMLQTSDVLQTEVLISDGAVPLTAAQPDASRAPACSTEIPSTQALRERLLKL